MEHVITPEIEELLVKELGNPELDPTKVLFLMKRLSLLTAVLLSNLAWSQIDSTMDPIATDRPTLPECLYHSRGLVPI